MTLCNTCNGKVDKKWNYCPKCGNKLTENFTLNDLINRQMEQFRKILDITGYDISIQPQSDNTFVINISNSADGDDYEDLEYESPKAYRQTEKIKHMEMPKNVTEPDVILKRKQGKLLLEIRLDGITNGEDVQITRMDNSMELRARNRDVGYFKILKIPGKYKLLDRRLENETLYLEFMI
jgi:hypothetical protein